MSDLDVQRTTILQAARVVVDRAKSAGRDLTYSEAGEVEAATEAVKVA